MGDRVKNIFQDVKKGSVRSFVPSKKDPMSFFDSARDSSSQNQTVFPLNAEKLHLEISKCRKLHLEIFKCSFAKKKAVASFSA